MSFFSQNHTETNSDDWTITKKTTRTMKHENLSKMKILKVDRWALSLRTTGISAMVSRCSDESLKCCLKIKIAVWRLRQWIGSSLIQVIMMKSSNGNIFRVTGHLCGEFTDHRWIPRTKASDGSFDVFFDLHPNKRLSKQSWDWWFETPSHPLWRLFNVKMIL